MLPLGTQTVPTPLKPGVLGVASVHSAHAYALSLHDKVTSCKLCIVSDPYTSLTHTVCSWRYLGEWLRVCAKIISRVRMLLLLFLVFILPRGKLSPV